MSLEIYDRTPDRVIVGCYFAPRDKDGRLVSQAGRRQARQRKATGEVAAPTGHPDAAGRELPPAESLEVPAEVWADGVPMDYTLMFWQWGRRRAMSTEQIVTAWRREVPKRA